MEQRKWLSWNDVERLAEHVLKTYSLSGAGGPRTCRVSCTSSRHRTGYGTKPPTEPTQHTENPCRNEVLQGRPAWVQTP